MIYSLFLGCTIPTRQMNYEQSAREVAKVLGIEFIDGEYGCCGFPLEPIDEIKALAMAAANLQKVSESGRDVVALCSACGEMLSKTENRLEADDATLEAVTKTLQQAGIEYKGKRPRVLHFARMLYDDYGLEKLKAQIKLPLTSLNIATHPGCHYVRPSNLYPGFDDPEFPGTLDRLVEATGAQALDYEGKTDCCGGGVLAIREDVAKAMTRNKLTKLSGKVDAMVVICPFCGIMYDKYQKTIEEELEKQLDVPILYYPQLLGLALGIEPSKLGFDINSVGVQGLLAKAGI
ncbi:MAG: CoB--CoM heterodisulfide reductase iron-sulfur subunit B family protein [Candidatus Bathyarchaeota archaeon]|nr:CoB--CoM heterodisulfide reductase iron-sulfur subunit B family protein [Candidatus Bathyarchaeota archaeon]